ncbi:MAG: hypothetical protein U5S82_08755 [Gammaproteobacteria bacterium]|nr:hypothetical protein [Gammaproteobacteria bacterium]
MAIKKRYGIGITVVTLAAVMASPARAADYQVESCQFIAEVTDPQGSSVPPGLDEPLNCDHKCFYDELGLDLLDDEKPNLHDMYSIGWRLIDIEQTQFNGKRIWTVYLERQFDGPKNECERTYAPKRLDDTENNQGN